MSENFLLTLPPDAPQEFAKALRLLAEAALPPNTPHDQAVKYLNEQTKIRTELLYPWFKGNLDGVGGNPENGKGRSKKFTPYYFEKLVRFFWGRKGGIQTYEEALAFAQAAGEEFVEALQEKWFTELQEKSNPPLEKAYKPFFTGGKGVERPALLQQVAAQFENCRKLKAPLVIYGPPGSGKTILIKQLLDTPLIWNRHFRQGTLDALLYGGPLQSYLPLWLQKITSQPIPNREGMEKPVTLQEVWQALHGQQRLLVIDDLQNLEEARQLKAVLPSQCVLIITTHDKTIAHTLARAEKLLLSMPGFTAEEGWAFAEGFFTDLASTKKPAVEGLNTLLQGNPGALELAFHLCQEVGWENTLAQLENPHPAEVIDGLETIYRPLQQTYAHLSPSLQEGLRLLGRLPWLTNYPSWLFEDLWDLNESETHRRLQRFANAGLLKATSQSGEETWQFHQSLYYFVQTLSNQATQTFENERWKGRALRRANVQTFFETVRHFYHTPGLRSLFTYLRAHNRALKAYQVKEATMRPKLPFGPGTPLTQELPFLHIEEYLFLEHLEKTTVFRYVSQLQKVNFVFYLAILGFIGLAVFQRFQILSFPEIFLPFFMLVIFGYLSAILVSFLFFIFVEGPRRTALHYHIYTRLQNQAFKEEEKSPHAEVLVG